MNNYNHCFLSPDFRYLKAPVDEAIDIGAILQIGDDYLVRHAGPDLNADNFIGIALQSSAPGDDFTLKVGIRGVYEFTCDEPCTFRVGECVKPVSPHIVQRSDEYVLGQVYRATSERERVLVDVRVKRLHLGGI